MERVSPWLERSNGQIADDEKRDGLIITTTATIITTFTTTVTIGSCLTLRFVSGLHDASKKACSSPCTWNESEFRVIDMLSSGRTSVSGTMYPFR